MSVSKGIDRHKLGIGFLKDEWSWAISDRQLNKITATILTTATTTQLISTARTCTSTVKTQSINNSCSCKPHLSSPTNTYQYQSTTTTLPIDLRQYFLHSLCGRFYIFETTFYWESIFLLSYYKSLPKDTIKNLFRGISIFKIQYQQYLYRKLKLQQ